MQLSELPINYTKLIQQRAQDDELCVEPCPVDCIHIKQVASEATIKPRATSQERYNAKRQRTINTKKKLTLDTEKNLAIANLYKNLTH